MKDIYSKLSEVSIFDVHQSLFLVVGDLSSQFFGIALLNSSCANYSKSRNDQDSSADFVSVLSLDYFFSG